MWGRAMAAAYVLVTASVHEWAEPVYWVVPALLAVAALVGLQALRKISPYWGGAWLRGVLGGLLAVTIALSLSGWRIEGRLADRLAPTNEDKVTRVVLRVVSLPKRSPDGVSFEGVVERSRPEGVPHRVLVFWPAPRGRGASRKPNRASAQASAAFEVPDLLPGQRWRMALNLRSPWFARNRWQRDGEALMFERGVRARGTVRGRPEALKAAPYADLETMANRVRYYLRAAMQKHVADKRYGGVLLALAIGDQDSVDDADWKVFRRSGIIHLVSISGSHITMVAALGGGLANWLWPRLRWRRRRPAERVPVRVVSAVMALFVAWIYCLLAGWGVPARRTFFMLLVLAAAWAWRMPLSGSRVLALAAVLVSALDPWAPRASGFWLSFGAVAVLMALSLRLGQQAVAGRRPQIAFLPLVTMATRAQLAVSAALLPVLAWLFHEVSLVSPLANAYAIAVVGWIVTPLSLLLAALSLPDVAAPAATVVADIAHAVLAGTMVPTAWLASLPIASVIVPAAPLIWYVLALAGVIMGLSLRGRAVRAAAWLLILPLMFWRPTSPSRGDWELHVLDVGQAGAALLRTRAHAFLFDTGQASAQGNDGERVVAPMLRALGLTRLDGLIVSHADLDHAGGLPGVLSAVSVRQSFTSFSLPALMARRYSGGMVPSLPVSMASCRRGVQWELDGVHFEFLWPLEERTDQRNAGSCVLRVAGRHHSILFTGDIGQVQERQLLRLGLSDTQVVMVPHHGSRSSSSVALTGGLGAEHAVAQAGPWNHHGHPHPRVESRWREAGAMFWRTDKHGGLTLQSRAGRLSVRAERLASPRLWSAPAAALP